MTNKNQSWSVSDLWHQQPRRNTLGFITLVTWHWGITAALCSQRLRWPGHVHHAKSCIKCVTDLAKAGTSGQWRPKKTYSDCVKNDVRVCGLSGIDPQDRDAWRADVWCCLVLPTPSNGTQESTLISNWNWWWWWRWMIINISTESIPLACTRKKISGRNTKWLLNIPVLVLFISGCDNESLNILASLGKFW